MPSVTLQIQFSMVLCVDNGFSTIKRPKNNYASMKSDVLSFIVYFSKYNLEKEGVLFGLTYHSKYVCLIVAVFECTLYKYVPVHIK